MQTDAQLTTLASVHTCVEEGRSEARAASEGIRSRMRFDGSLNILGMVTLIIMAGGGLVAAVKWTDHVDQTLTAHSDRLDRMETHLGSIDSSLAVVASSVSGQGVAMHHFHRAYKP